MATAHGVSQALRTRPGLALVLFAIGFGVALAIEWLLLAGRGFPAPVVPGAGLLGGALLITGVRRWPAFLLCALVLRGLFVIGTDATLPPWTAMLEVVGTIAATAMLGAVPWLVRHHRPGELAPNELVPNSIVVATGAAILLSTLRFLVAGDGAAGAIISGLGFLLGLIICAPPVVVLGRRTHARRPASAKRVLQVAASTTAFVVLTLVALGQQPASVWSLFGEYAAGWIWVAAVTGVLMVLRSHSILSHFTIALVSLASALTFFSFTLRQAGNWVPATINWQISALGLLVILISANALIGVARRANDQRRAQQNISHAMLARAERHSVDAPEGADEFGRALGVAAAAGGADAARLFWIDSASRRIGIAYEWPAPGDAAQRHEPVDLRSVTPVLEPVLLGRDVRLTGDGAWDAETRDALQALGLAGQEAVYLQPIVFGGRAVGAIGLMTRSGLPFRAIEVSPLLTMIAEFYVSDMTRERANRSVANYQRRLRELAARTAQAEERVRRLTAVELHDGLIQRLAVARMKLGELRHRTGDAGPIGAITDIVDEALAASRAIIHDLSPSVVYELGLIPGLEKLVDDSRTEGRFELALREHGAGGALDEPLRVGIYHVVEELVANSIEHSGGDRIWIDVYWEQAALDAVVVSDNGRDDAWWLSETAADEPSGLGLLSASERLRPIGYDIKFEQRLGGGTRAIVYWSSATDG